MSMIARLAAALGLTFLVTVPGGVASARPPAQYGAFERIDRYDVDVTVERSGRLHVVETIDYVFTTPKHGIERRLPVRVHYNDTHDRTYPVGNLRVTGSPGTPVQVKTSTDDGYRVVRVGDPDRKITGPHRYVITYDLRGALNRFEGHDELYWNVVGHEWLALNLSSTVRVHAEEPFTASNCFAGPRGSTLACRSASLDGRVATFGHGLLVSGSGMTVTLALPRGYAAETGPILAERWNAQTAFSTGRVQTAAAGLVLVGGLGWVGAMLRRTGRDRQYAGQVPGLEPAAGMDVATEPAPIFGDRAGPVEWSPGDVAPGLMGVLLDEEVHTLDVTATIVDLAGRGHLVIEELPRRGLFRRRDWRLSRVVPAPQDPTTAWEHKTLSGLFAKASTVQMSDLKNEFHTHLTEIKESLYDESVRRGWFTNRPDAVRGRWFGIGLAVLLAGGALTYVLARWTSFGLAGLAAAATGVALLAVHRRMPFRTARGTAAYARALGFRRYLATAEADQLRSEEKAGVFARYLPYAVVLGETDRWAKVFKDLGLTPQQHMGWYSGPSGWSMDDFGDSMSSFSSTASTTIASTPGSSGSSGFSGGGSSGGGGGGGGGGSW